MHIKRDILMQLSDPEFRRAKPRIASKYAEFTIPVSDLNSFEVMCASVLFFASLARGGRVGRVDFGRGDKKANENRT